MTGKDPWLFSRMPWWCSPGAALTVYLFVGHALPGLLFENRSALAGIKEALAAVAPILGLLLLLPMPFAYVHGRRKQRPVDTNKDLGSIGHCRGASSSNCWLRHTAARAKRSDRI